jgi:cytochrome c oxidase subunit IV
MNSHDNRPTLHEEGTGEPVKATPEYTPGESEKLPEPENAVDQALISGYKAAEEAAETSPVVQGFDAAVTALQDAVDKVPGAPETRTEAYAEHHSDTVDIMGRKITVPGGIYTVVFGALGVATIVEVLLAGLPRGFLTIPVMLSLAIVKAVLVVMYYMHLRTDSRIFTAVLLLPILVALASMLFLLAVPMTGY